MERLHEDMKVVVISDTHLQEDFSLVPPDSIPLIKEAELVIHLGDITTIKAYEYFKSLNKNLVAVQGNWDYELSHLPIYEVLEIEGVRVGIVHGHIGKGGFGKINNSGSAYRAYNFFKDNLPEVILFGHSHKVCDFVHNNVRLINPGSLVEGQRTLLCIDLKNKHIKLELKHFGLI